ncbi:MAG: CocE/NonD family hydrolase [Vicinamibacteria bacterium]|nr:CocE/NonD family hydrolase [Vicinamibacteria bacterium]
MRTGGEILEAAFGEHEGNRYLDRDLVRIEHRDDPLSSASSPTTLDTQSPFAFASSIEASGVAILAQAGWFDGPFCAEMIALHNTVRGAHNQIVVGPWGHHGRFHCSPSIDGEKRSEFDHAAEIVRFFDLHLRETPRGEAGPAVRYYTTGLERWNESPEWPPPGLHTQRLFLGPDLSLSPAAPARAGHDVHHVDPHATTGAHSRFGKHLEGGRYPVTYPDRRRADRKLLVYDSSPLKEATEVTGHPIVTLFIRSDAPDGAFLAYLEDVEPDGRVAVVTDGGLRARFRPLSPSEPPYWRPGLHRTCERKDAMPLVAGEVAELTFDLYPLSHTFFEGHRIRLAIAGADLDNFAPIAGCEAPRIEVHFGPVSASSILLPVMNRRQT